MVVDNARSIVDNYRRTLKERELAKSATAQSIVETDLEAQDSTPDPATETATISATTPATDPAPNPGVIPTSMATEHTPAAAT